MCIPHVPFYHQVKTTVGYSVHVKLHQGLCFCSSLVVLQTEVLLSRKERKKSLSKNRITYQLGLL